MEKSASETAAELWVAISDISYDAEEIPGLIDCPGEEWLRRQIEKVVTILSDSCNAARATAEELKKLLEDFTGMEDQNIILHDCTMHLSANFEKKCLAQLENSPSRKVLSLVSSLFGARNSHRDRWRIQNLPLRAAFEREVGVRKRSFIDFE